MRLYFSTDYVRNSTITNEQGQMLYKVITPFRPFVMTATSTIWKITPNTPPLYSAKSTNESDTELEVEGDNSDDPNVVPVTEEHSRIQSDEDEEEEIILNMQDHFAQLAQIEFHNFQTPSLIRWFGLNKLGRGEVSTKEFMPPRGFIHRSRTFTGPDDRAYRWNLGVRVCKLYLESEPNKPVAQYHRRILGLMPGKRSRPGFLDINLPKSNHNHENTDMANYTDYELEHTLDSDTISPELLDTIIVTFIYVEKIRRKEDNRRLGRKTSDGITS